ncbi:6-phosphogluconolactonase [Nonomuraea sp. K274]|uniref:6-phosphogluconolactonase n=1 Tax=Nonomuraea cypriaca TaxID=1187855 RepID=A0A931A4Y7_9ACTN|nr:6-phosphogluconolactonase [Nonomuraea cypriaca]MBF8185218.1 6-phosphogluconolactonase [Nonomuraea cypriaca]
MRHDLQILDGPDAVTARAADEVANLATTAVVDHGRFTFAVSGGHTPWQMFAALVTRDLPWPNITIFQADERVAPDGDPDRNLTHLRESLGAVGAEVVPMPVTDADLEAAARRYAELLPARFDLVHLGLGPDGHTASLVPGYPVLTETDRLVALTRPYQGHPRMTLTYPALARADQLLLAHHRIEQANAAAQATGR